MPKIVPGATLITAFALLSGFEPSRSLNTKKTNNPLQNITQADTANTAARGPISLKYIARAQESKKKIAINRAPTPTTSLGKPATQEKLNKTNHKNAMTVSPAGIHNLFLGTESRIKSCSNRGSHTPTLSERDSINE
jgi:hypothetical protein